MNLSLQKDRLAVCQLASDAAIPVWVAGKAAFSSLSRTSEELSIVCPESVVPADVKAEAGWRVFKVDGPLDFALTGILASIAAPLAQAGVSFGTDKFDNPIALFPNDWTMRYFKEKNPELKLHELPLEQTK